MTMTQLPQWIFWPNIVGGYATLANGYVTVDYDGKGLAFIFAAPRSGTIKKIGWRTRTVTAGGNMLVRLETVSGGLPSGSLVADGATKTETVQNTDDNIPFLTELTTAPSVTKGQIIAAVVKAAGSFGGNLQLGFVTNSETYGPIPFGTQTRFNYLALNTGSWAVSVGVAIMSICYDDGEGGDVYYPLVGTWPGQPTNISGFDSGDSPDEIGNRFTIPFRARAVGLWAYIDADADCTLKLYGPSTVTISVESDNRSSTNGGAFFFPFAAGDEQILAANTVYRATVLPGESGITIYNLPVQAAAMLDQIDGQACHQTERTDAGAWTDTTTKRCLSIGVILDQIDLPTAAVYPAEANVWHDTGAYGPEGNDYTPAMVGSDIPNLEAGNVKSGVTIDDVTGTYEGEGGGGAAPAGICESGFVR